jgi:hypothetical protein
MTTTRSTQCSCTLLPHPSLHVDSASNDVNVNILVCVFTRTFTASDDVAVDTAAVFFFLARTSLIQQGSVCNYSVARCDTRP